MANQRDLARALGVSQVAISLALRDDPSISPSLRGRVKTEAKRLGYKPNPYVSTLMAHIRAGRKASEKGVLALVIDVFQREEWHRHESYKVYYQGLMRRSAELGFHLEEFYLQAPGMTAAKVDRILHARGVRGVILAPPYLGNRRLAMKWTRYACVGTGYGWEQQQFDRVAHDHAQNVVLAFQRTTALGYKRIGMCIPSFYAKGRGARWLDGFLACQYRLPIERQVPLFVGSVEEKSFAEFRKWQAQHKPDAILSVYGHEQSWLKEMGLGVPGKIGLACLIVPPGKALAGINDRYDQIGAATVELVASKIGFNQYGIPPYPKVILIEGHWVDGKSLKRVGRAQVPDFNLS